METNWVDDWRGYLAQVRELLSGSDGERWLDWIESEEREDLKHAYFNDLGDPADTVAARHGFVRETALDWNDTDRDVDTLADRCRIRSLLRKHVGSISTRTSEGRPLA